jgi:uncharacterized lipoprotein YehR (DUF1307 family)
MKKLFKKTSAIVLLMLSMSVTLIGCGTSEDSAGMGKSSSTIGLFDF